MEKIKLSKEIKLINQGTYGCVFKKGMTCDGMVDDEETISKIVEIDITSENEVNIGKKIMEIPDYLLYFAPIISSCTIDMSNMESEELNKCRVIYSNKRSKKKLKFQMNKIPYVGNKSIQIYLLELLENKNKVEVFTTEFINLFVELLEGYSLLHDQNLIHMDVKSNNIMVNEKKRPIIIDFGLTFNIEEMKDAEKNDKETYNEMLDLIFFNPEAEYPYWCFDIFVINYAINEILFNKKTRAIVDMPINIQELEKCASIYFDSNRGMTTLLTEEEKVNLKNQYLKYLKEISNQDDQMKINSTTWLSVISKLLDNAKTWDIYGLVIAYLEMFETLKLNEMKENNNFLQSFYNELKEYIKKYPIERISASKLSIDLKENLRTVPTVEKKKVITSLIDYLNSRINRTNRKKDVLLSVEKQENIKI